MEYPSQLLIYIRGSNMDCGGFCSIHNSNFWTIVFLIGGICLLTFLYKIKKILKRFCEKIKFVIIPDIKHTIKRFICHIVGCVIDFEILREVYYCKRCGAFSIPEKFDKKELEDICKYYKIPCNVPSYQYIDFSECLIAKLIQRLYQISAKLIRNIKEFYKGYHNG